MTPPLIPEDKQRATGILVAVGLLLLVFGFSAMLALPTYLSRSNPVWFIGMLIIFGSALALIAIVFRWLGLSAQSEAFGLPAGSVRTLLAVGVMVLFAVFGLQAMAPDEASQRLAEVPMGDAVVTGTAAQREAEIARYKAMNIAAVVASVDKDTATLKLYRIERYKPSETVDMEKQIITALVTLVTSVVSFYFGSRSVEGARDVQDRGPTKLAESTSADIDALDTGLTDASTRLTALRADTASPGNEAALATAVSQADADLKTVQDGRAKLDAAVKDLGTGANTPEAVTASVAALKSSLDALATLLSQAEALAAKG